MKPIIKKLAGGDFRSIGKSNEVVEQVLANPKIFDDVFSGFFESDSIVRMRTADAVEKITKQRPELLQKYKKTILEQVANIQQQEVQWHVAQIIPRLNLTKSEVTKAQTILDRYLRVTNSNIVRVMSLQAMADLATQGKIGKENVIRGIEEYTEMVNTPSVRARARKLLKQLGKK